MGSSSKTKRVANDDNDDGDEADIERFNEIVEKFRVPYDWFRAKISGSSTDLLDAVTNGNDRDRKKRRKDKVDGDSKRRIDVWMPCFVLEDFTEEAPVEFAKPTLQRSEETAAVAVAVAAEEAKTASETIKDGGEEKKENNEELDLSLSL